ncbi:MAG: leucine-rich repeat domain-containing protein [Treponema sp.]|nr:leucine-rich repeat domain-containing protein [Treponema sp.]
MDVNYIKKNGLIYTSDMQTIVGIDTESSEFTGRVPFGARYIEGEVFSGCNYEQISLPDSVKQVGNCLFENSKNLKKVKLPSTLIQLSAYMFSGCSSLEQVNMPYVVDFFPEGLFNGCSSMPEIPFRAGLTSLPENCLAGCSSLRTLVIPNTVERIYANAVADCTSLTTIVFPETLYQLDDDAFKGCNNISKIRMNGNNPIFFVNEEDGCLYEKTAKGDKLKLKVNKIQNDQIQLFKDNVDDETEPFFTNEDNDEIDETFSSEIEGAEDEFISVAPEEEIIMGGNNVDEAVNDIMNEEKDRNELTQDVSVGKEEGEILTQMIDVMNDSPNVNNGTVSDEELADLFSSNESSETISESMVAPSTDDAQAAKMQILLDSVQLNRIIENTPAGELPIDTDLFVIAEKTVDADGVPVFSAKLEKCCRTFAHVQDFKRIVLLSGLPVDDDEFSQFFYHFISQRNVVFACEANCPAKLSEYAKKICKLSRISLDHDDLVSQRKKISIKNKSLIKIVIQDKYD